jgi:hypothetical protein
MFLITLISELVNERSIVSMMEDVWTLPFLVALYALPSSPNPWIFFVRNAFYITHRMRFTQLFRLW